MTVVPRVVLSAPSSGHGKTAVAVGLLAALASRGLAPAAFKVGPDQVDAAYLGLAAGRAGRNLDPRLVGAARIAPLFAHGAAGAGIAVVEGSMGLYDSVAGHPETESTAAVATALRSPVVLVVDVATMGQSVAALVHGFRAYDELLWLGGVILNRVASDRHGELLREALDDIAVPVLGALGRGDLPPVLPSRERGVVPALRAGTEALRAVQRFGAAVAARVDVDRLAALAGAAPPLPVEPWSPAGALPSGPVTGARPVVALAGGPQGSFSHPETAELLAAAGAEVATLDPLCDESLPSGTAALVIGGGLPESYVGELSANRRLSAGIGTLARSGRPVLAVGVGLLWLAREVDGQPMCGVLDTAATTRDGVVVGYRTAVAGTASLVGPVGTRVVGYKCHRAVLTPRSGVAPAWNWPGGAPEGFVWQGVHASQLGLHWAGSPEIARRVVDAAGLRDQTGMAREPTAGTLREAGAGG